MRRKNTIRIENFTIHNEGFNIGITNFAIRLFRKEIKLSIVYY